MPCCFCRFSQGAFPWAWGTFELISRWAHALGTPVGLAGLLLPRRFVFVAVELGSSPRERPGAGMQPSALWPSVPPPLLPQGAPCFLSSSVVLESMFVSVLASQCFCKSKAALRHVWGPLPGSAHPHQRAPRRSLCSCGPCPRCPAGPASRWSACAHRPPSWLQGHASLRDLEFQCIWGMCVYIFYCILSSLLKPETSVLVVTVQSEPRPSH